MWKRLRQPLSVNQLVVAVVMIALIGVTLYGSYRVVSGYWHRRMLEGVIPAALEGTRAQRQVLIGLIESYKDRFGYYPPLLTKPGSDRGVVNPLCYELLGVRFEPKRREFHIPVTKDGLTMETAQKFFSAPTFSNCLSFPLVPTNFLANRMPVAPLAQDPDLFGVSLDYTDFVPEPFWYDFDFSTWRYVTNPAQHNSGKFDLWIEITVAGKRFTIGNWPEVN